MSARTHGVNRLRRERPLAVDEQVDLHEKVQHGANAAHLANYAEETLLRGQEKKIRDQMFAAIDSDEPLDPQKATQAWIELRSAYKLIKDLRRAQTAGEVAHKRLRAQTEEA